MGCCESDDAIEFLFVKTRIETPWFVWFVVFDCGAETDRSLFADDDVDDSDSDSDNDDDDGGGSGGGGDRDDDGDNGDNGDNVVLFLVELKRL